MKNILLFICALLPVVAFAQGENDHWYFGYHAAVNFSSPTPVALNNSALEGFEACGTVSDPNGNLLFYTDGKEIRNRQHQIMQNGSGLTGNSSTQQLVIVKHPGNANQYFVFTGGYNDPASLTRISYSIVDMSQGNIGTNGSPLGKVLDNFKNIPVTNSQGNTFRSEAITVVPSPYGSLWVLIPSGASLYSYTVNNLGFNNGNPVVSPLSFPLPLVPPNHFGIRASPIVSSGYPFFSNYLCISAWSTASSYVNMVYSFNNVTGHITNNYLLQINDINSYGVEFNQNASVLFLGGYRIFAVDLLTSTPSSINMMEVYNFGSNATCGTIQRNKYNDIYVSQPNNNFLGRILNPDVYGPGISVDMSNVFLGLNLYGTNAEAMYGLPQSVEVPVNTYYPCIGNLTLSAPEINNNYVYYVSNTITTNAAYTVSPHQNITMKAGQSITLLPDTYIMNRSDYLAKIERCNPYALRGVAGEENHQPVTLGVNNAAAQQDNVLVYPNPASTFIQIDVRQDKLRSWELCDMTGKMVLSGVANKVNVESLPKSVYLMKVLTESGKSSHKKVTIQ